MAWVGSLRQNFEPNTAQERSRLALLTLLTALLAFWGVGWMILAVPGLLYQVQRSLALKQRLAALLAWGLSFAAIYYSWAIYYGLLPWLGLVLVRGLPWLLFPLPTFLLETFYPKAAVELRALACGLGYGAVAFLLLLGPTGADWDTPMAGLTAWPWTLALLPWLGLVGGAVLLGTCSGALFTCRKRAGLGGLLLLSVWLGVSAWAFSLTSAKRVGTPLALVQTGWEQGMKWDEGNVQFAKERLFELTESAAAEGAHLVIWPETAWPHMGMRRRPKDSRAIGKLARRLQVDILASSIEEGPQGWFNSVSLVGGNGRFEAEYKKRRLAPFAEYIPLPSQVEYTLREMAPFKDVSPYLPGEEMVVMESSGERYGVLVCYESMIAEPTEELSEFVDFIVVVTNDAPFRWEAPKEAHFRSAILRAIEFEVPVFQAANTGVTGIIDSKGQVLARTEPGFSGPAVKLFEPTGSPIERARSSDPE